MFHEATFTEDIQYLLLGAGEHQGHAPGIEAVGQALDHLHAGGIDLVDALAVDDQVLEPFLARHVGQDAGFEVAGIRKVKRTVEAHDGHDLVGGQVVERGGAQGAVLVQGQFHEARPHGAIQVQSQGQQHADDDGLVQVRRHHQGQHEGDDGHPAVMGLDLHGVTDGGDLHQVGHRHHDHRRQGGLGQMVEQRGQEQQGDGHHGTGDHSGKAGAGTGGEVHRRAGKGSGHRVGLEQAGRDIGHTLAHQLLVGVQALTGLAGHGLGDGNGLHEADQGNGDGRGHQLAGHGPAELGDTETGQATGHHAHHRATRRLEAEQPGGQGGHHHRGQHTGDLRGVFLQQDHDGQGHDAHDQGEQVGILAGFHQHPPHGFIVMLGAFHADPEDLGKLRGGDDDGGAVGEAHHHGMGQEVHQHAEAEQPEHELEAPHHDGQQGRVHQVALRVGRGDGLQGGGGHEGDHRHGARGQLARGAQEGGDDDGNERGVQTHVGWQAGQLRIGHGLGHQHQGNGDARQQVRAQGTRITQFPQPFQEGHKTTRPLRHYISQIIHLIDHSGNSGGQSGGTMA